jgi:hypothetical protein
MSVISLSPALFNTQYIRIHGASTYVVRLELWKNGSWHTETCQAQAAILADCRCDANMHVGGRGRDPTDSAILYILALLSTCQPFGAQRLAANGRLTIGSCLDARRPWCPDMPGHGSLAEKHQPEYA